MLIAAWGRGAHFRREDKRLRHKAQPRCNSIPTDHTAHTAHTCINLKNAPPTCRVRTLAETLRVMGSIPAIDTFLAQGTGLLGPCMVWSFSGLDNAMPEDMLVGGWVGGCRLGSAPPSWGLGQVACPSPTVAACPFHFTPPLPSPLPSKGPGTASARGIVGDGRGPGAGLDRPMLWYGRCFFFLTKWCKGGGGYRAHSRLFSTPGSHRSRVLNSAPYSPCWCTRDCFSLMLATGTRVLNSAPPMLLGMDHACFCRWVVCRGVPG